MRFMLLASLCTVSTLSFAAGLDSSFTKVQEGVYQKVDQDGSTTTLAFGEAGANYDKARLGQLAEDIRARIAAGSNSPDDAKALSDTLVASSSIPAHASGTIKPETSTSGTVCGYPYQFDSQLIVGEVGADAIARAILAYQQFAPLPPALTSSQTYVSATVTGGRTPYTQTQNLSPNSQGTPIEADARYLPNYSGYPTTCTASTFAYIQATNSTCNGSAGYISQSKSYSSCTTSP